MIENKAWRRRKKKAGTLYGVLTFEERKDFSGWERNTAPLFSQSPKKKSIRTGVGKSSPTRLASVPQTVHICVHLDFLEGRPLLPSGFFTPALELSIFILNFQRLDPARFCLQNGIFCSRADASKNPNSANWSAHSASFRHLYERKNITAFLFLQRPS